MNEDLYKKASSMMLSEFDNMLRKSAKPLVEPDGLFRMLEELKERIYVCGSHLLNASFSENDESLEMMIKYLDRKRKEDANREAEEEG